MKTWRYYNHAMIPTTHPHEEVDVETLNSKDFWKENKNALLARWTSDFDCGYETNWWYVIRDGEFDVDKLPSKQRKHIRQALRKCYAKQISCCAYAEDLFRVYEEAIKRYINADGEKQTKERFLLNCIDRENVTYWAGFDAATDRMIGYMIVLEYSDYVAISVAKFSADFLKLQVSDVLYATVLEHYLNKKGKQYVLSGERSILHHTNTQAYKIRTFGYRKAYCRLHIAYNPKIRWVIKLIYPFRSILCKFDGIGLVHQINAVLKMEEIVRSDK